MSNDGWVAASTAPEDVPVETKIDDELGVRNEQVLIRKGNRWWFPDNSMYVYYTPTHYRNMTMNTAREELEKASNLYNSLVLEGRALTNNTQFTISLTEVIEKPGKGYCIRYTEENKFPIDRSLIYYVSPEEEKVSSSRYYSFLKTIETLTSSLNNTKLEKEWEAWACSNLPDDVLMFIGIKPSLKKYTIPSKYSAFIPYDSEWLFKIEE